MAGWIKLHRQIMDHWIWEDSKRFKWWMELILLTNHTDKKTVIGGNLVTIKRGTFHTSEIKLAERWGVSRNTVRKFLDLLEADDMISTKKTINGTTIKVHNYNVYQGNTEEKKHQTEQRNEQYTEQQTEQNTEQNRDNELNKTKNVKNDKELKNEKNVRSSSNNDDFRTVVSMYQENIELNPAPVTFQKIQQDFNDYGKDIMLYAIEKSALKNNHNYSFINYLLNDWKKKQLTTVDEIKQSEHNFEFKKQSTYSKQQQSKEITPSWINQEYVEPERTPEEEARLEEERRRVKEEIENLWKDDD
ncbi:DnaD domain protein [Macrococcoides canis]|uniref:DnaD domain protein n=1 Tax=Macrococcoides canis TaxID=1855823 RepID=UPI0020B701D8|nr:DnaD domain protein [Macrococcus canis]UTG99342.1 DnaD domain protein [Macrococcus canis]